MPFGVRLGPHLETAKSIDVARPVMNGAQGLITVSTLKEGEYFFSHGVSDLLYAVSIAPNKLDHVFDLRRRGADLEPGRVQQRQNQSIIWNSIYE